MIFGEDEKLQAHLSAISIGSSPLGLVGDIGDALVDIGFAIPALARWYGLTLGFDLHCVLFNHPSASTNRNNEIDIISMWLRINRTDIWYD